MPSLQGMLERVYDGAPARAMGDPARRLDASPAGRPGARAGIPQAPPARVRARVQHLGAGACGRLVEVVEVVEDGGGPTFAGARSVNKNAPRPGEICRELLATLDASEGRRRRRKRDTTPDAIGLTIKRELLERAVAPDPEPDAFEEWLHRQCFATGSSEGGLPSTART